MLSSGGRQTKDVTRRSSLVLVSNETLFKTEVLASVSVFLADGYRPFLCLFWRHSLFANVNND